MMEGRILRTITVNAAVEDSAPVLARLQAMGLAAWEPAAFPDPPGQIEDTTIRLGGGGNLSLVTPLAPTSPIRRFLDKKGPGYASITVQVDDLDKAIERWSAAGVEWWQAEPHVFHEADFGDCRVERARVNWTDPRSLFGVSFEVVEFQGWVHPRTDWIGTTTDDDEEPT
jgi:4-hydroxyphenylpyruvate dioxygenase-like putative hemolysin